MKQQGGMAIENEPWLKSTNDFALLGLKFLYFSNAGAIVAILANIHSLKSHGIDYHVVACALAWFVGGIISAIFANFFGYLLHSNILITKQNNRQSRLQVWYRIFAIILGAASIVCFAWGACKAISIIK
jgi:hypothetical protein